MTIFSKHCSVLSSKARNNEEMGNIFPGQRGIWLRGKPAGLWCSDVLSAHNLLCWRGRRFGRCSQSGIDTVHSVVVTDCSGVGWEASQTAAWYWLILNLLWISEAALIQASGECPSTLPIYAFCMWKGPGVLGGESLTSGYPVHVVYLAGPVSLLSSDNPPICYWSGSQYW